MKPRPFLLSLLILGATAGAVRLQDAATQVGRAGGIEIWLSSDKQAWLDNLSDDAIVEGLTAE